MAQRITPQMIGTSSYRRRNLRCAIYGCLKHRRAENVVEVVVCQQDMGHVAAGHLMNVLRDPVRLRQRRTGVDQQSSGPTMDEAHGDVQKRETAAQDAIPSRSQVKFTAPRSTAEP